MNEVMKTLGYYLTDTRAPRKPWHKSPGPKSNWNLKKQRKVLDSIGTKLGYKELNDWYKIRKQDLVKHGASPILDMYDSIPYLLNAVYPEQTFYAYKFEGIPKGLWDSALKTRQYLDAVLDDLSIESQQQMYQISFNTLRKKGASKLMYLFGSSVMRMFEEVYPEYRWIPWMFPVTSRGVWDNPQTRREFLDWFAEQSNIQTQADWFKVQVVDVRNKGGSTVMSYQNNSLFNTLKELYPEFLWYPWLFWVSRGFWENLSNQRAYFQWLGEELGIEKLDDWYSVQLSDVIATGGRGVLTKGYKFSLARALAAVFPEHTWYPWKFEKSPSNWWSDETTLQQFVQQLMEQLNITKMEDWYGVTWTQLRTVPGYSIFKTFNGVFEFVNKIFPDYPWDRELFAGNKGQTHVFRYCQQIFPDCSDIHFNFRHSEMLFTETGRAMELDVFIPSLSLAFEYHGNYHYTQDHVLYGSTTTHTRNDMEKKEACKRMGITLIEIPYWWDQCKESLIATIHQHRTDLIPDPGSGTPIPPNPPPLAPPKKKHHRKAVFSSPPEDFNPTGWVMSENARHMMYWDGTKFHLHGGITLIPPVQFLKGMPSTKLFGFLL